MGRQRLGGRLGGGVGLLRAGLRVIERAGLKVR